MRFARRTSMAIWAATFAAIIVASAASGQDQPRREAQPPASQPDRARRGPRGPVVISPEVREDRHVVFRILAPKAESVRLSGGDIPGDQRQRGFTKGENGVWELTLGPIDPGTYRYVFDIDGVPTADPHNPK